MLDVGDTEVAEDEKYCGKVWAIFVNDSIFCTLGVSSGFLLFLSICSVFMSKRVKIFVQGNMKFRFWLIILCLLFTIFSETISNELFCSSEEMFSDNLLDHSYILWQTLYWCVVFNYQRTISSKKKNVSIKWKFFSSFSTFKNPISEPHSRDSEQIAHWRVRQGYEP